MFQRVLQYLKATPRRGLLFKKGCELTLEVHTYANYAGSPVDRRSTISYCIFLICNLMTWKSNKQSVIARSSVEAMLRAMAHEI